MERAINGVRIDDPLRPYVIAELSGNHGQNYEQAKRLVRAAAEAGADAVKVQTFTPEEICVDMALPYGHNATADAWFARMGVTNMRELFSKGGFPREWHAKLKRYAKRQGVTFLSTPFSVNAAKFLVNEIGVPALKIASGDLTFTPLLAYASKQDIPILLSTGCADVEEIYATATSTLYGPLIKGSLVVLHCVSIYPCPEQYATLRAIETIRQRFEGLPQAIPRPVLGWSDHTLDPVLVPALALAQGATVFEKHLRLEDDRTSVDVEHSLTPGQFGLMVEMLRRAAVILGTGEKPQGGELHDRLWARRDASDWLRPTLPARQGRWA